MDAALRTPNLSTLRTLRITLTASPSGIVEGEVGAYDAYTSFSDAPPPMEPLLL